MQAEPRPISVLKEPAAHGMGKALPCGQKFLDKMTQQENTTKNKYDTSLCMSLCRCLILQYPCGQTAVHVSLRSPAWLPYKPAAHSMQAVTLL